MPSRSTKMLSIDFWYTSGELHKSYGSRGNLYLLKGVAMVYNLELPKESGICKNSEDASKTEKYFAWPILANIACWVGIR